MPAIPAHAAAKILPLLLAGASALAAPVLPLEDFTRHSDYQVAEISPDGRHIAVTLRLDGEEVFAIIRRDTKKPVTAVHATDLRASIARVFWISNERLIYKTKTGAGWYEEPAENGTIYAVDFDGSKHEALAGSRVVSPVTGTHIKSGQRKFAHFDVIDRLKDDHKHILAIAYPYGSVGNSLFWDPDAHPEVFRVNVYNGLQKKLDVIPHGSAVPLVDHDGNVRFAFATDAQFERVFFYKAQIGDDWQRLAAGTFAGEDIAPLGFAPPGNGLYYLSRRDNGTTGLMLLNLESMQSSELYHDPQVGISRLIRDASGRRIVAVGTELLAPTFYYLDAKDPRARHHRMLSKAFPGQIVEITSSTDDDRYLIVRAVSDTSPGDYYLFDTDDKQAEFLMARRSWIDPRHMAKTEARAFEMRDGKTVYGYVTWPQTAGDTPLPLIVLPHGGPHGVRDYWGFDPEVQLFANRGYAVLQVNFRGSGGYGRAFERAGYREWGGLMQDDLTDATRALVKEGRVDETRVCIVGHSYGGYAALMGIVREPGLYRCAVGSMGVYDLNLMHSRGEISGERWGAAYLEQAIGSDSEQLAARSPTSHADKISAPVLLIHGRADERAPIEHARAMMQAMDAHDRPYEWLEIKDEGHGYYDEDNRARIYTAVLDFLQRHTAVD